MKKTKKAQSALKPCPICSSAVNMEIDNDCIFVYCKNCGLESGRFYTARRAMSVWNKFIGERSVEDYQFSPQEAQVILNLVRNFTFEHRRCFPMTIKSILQKCQAIIERA